MPDTTKQVLKARSSSHSDVAESDAAKSHLAAMTERQFGAQLHTAVREAKGGLLFRNYRNEWHTTDDGVVYEISIDAEPTEE